MTEIPSYPKPPEGPPKQSGGGGPAPMSGPTEVTALKGAGSGAGGSNAGGDSPEQERKKQEDVKATLGSDSLEVGTADGGPLTMQAAFYRLNPPTPGVKKASKHLPSRLVATIHGLHIAQQHTR